MGFEENIKKATKGKRFELKIGKFGFFYYDKLTCQDLSLSEVAGLLNMWNPEKDKEYY